MMPFRSPSEASFMAALILSYEAGLTSLTARSPTDTSATGTRNDMPVSFPFNSGMTKATALAAPVEEGIIFWYAPLPPRQSFMEGLSTVFCVAVTAWMVLIRPSRIPNLSFNTLARGAKQLVVHDALETIVLAAVIFLWLTPITKVGVSSFAGAEKTTFLAPALMCFWPSA